MPRSLHRLTAKAVENLKQPGIYSDGGNLLCRVTTKGKRNWIFRFNLHGRARDAGLGSFPTVTLADARSKSDAMRKLLADGIDPIEARNAERVATLIDAARTTTFKQCANAYMASHEAGWKNAKHRDQWRATLQTYAYPVIGRLPVSAVSTADVLKVLEPIWASKPETASRLRGRIEVVLSWEKVRGFRDGENPALWRGHLDHLLPPKSEVRKVRHHPALPYTEIPAFMRLLRQQPGQSARALEFLILTATRTSETLGAAWSEIDGRRHLWSIPGARMKAGNDHRVPLSRRASQLVAEQKAWGTGDYVFPGHKPGHPLSQMSLLMALRRMGYGHVTAHGFRSSFRDWVAESTAYSGEVAELALAHAIPSAVEAAYRRGDMLEKRRAMMEDWAGFCDSHRAASCAS